MEGCQICETNGGNGHIPASGLSEDGRWVRTKLKHEWAIRYQEMSVNRIRSHISGTQPDVVGLLEGG
jgi:hypothetical protein